MVEEEKMQHGWILGEGFLGRPVGEWASVEDENLNVRVDSKFVWGKWAWR